MSKMNNHVANRAFELLTSVLTCPQCNKTLENPILLACGHTICLKHAHRKGQPWNHPNIIVCKTCNSRNQNYSIVRNIV